MDLPHPRLVHNRPRRRHRLHGLFDDERRLGQLMYLFLDYNPSDDDVSYCLSDERLLIKEKGRLDVADPRFIALLHSALPITFDASAFFLSPGLNCTPFALFDLKRLFRAYYGVKEDITYSEAITQFDEQVVLAGSPSFSFMLHFADFEGEEPSSLISQDYQDCFLSFPLHRDAFIALKDMKRVLSELMTYDSVTKSIIHDY